MCWRVSRGCDGECEAITDAEETAVAFCVSSLDARGGDVSFAASEAFVDELSNMGRLGDYSFSSLTRPVAVVEL